ncbi:hypothetical protein HK098_005400 [Nowakowskiella sp. JEL0407]|nr:hypothetical protein HK098_005400 [Nowakowskiella sp. JEL0407]
MRNKTEDGQVFQRFAGYPNDQDSTKSLEDLFNLLLDETQPPAVHMYAYQTINNGDYRSKSDNAIIRKYAPDLILRKECGWYDQILERVIIYLAQSDLYKINSEPESAVWILDFTRNLFSTHYRPGFHSLKFINSDFLRAINDLTSQISNYPNAFSNERERLAEFTKAILNMASEPDWLSAIFRLLKVTDSKLIEPHLQELEALFQNPETLNRYYYELPDPVLVHLLPLFKKRIDNGEFENLTLSPLLTNESVKRPLAVHIFSAMKSHPNQNDPYMQALMQSIVYIGVLYSANPEMFSDPENLKWVLQQSSPDWDMVTIQVPSDSYTHCVRELIMYRLKDGIYKDAYTMKLVEILKFDKGRDNFLKCLDDLMDFVKSNVDLVSNQMSTWGHIWDAVSKTGKLVNGLVKYTKDFLELIPKIHNYTTYANLVYVLVRKLPKSDQEMIKSPEFLEILRGAILNCFRQAMEFVPSGYVSCFGFIGELDESMGEIVIKILLDIVIELEPDVNYSQMKALTVQNIFSAIKGVAEKAKPDILTPHKETLQQLAKSDDLTQALREQAQEILNIESGLSIHQIAEVWSTLGLSRSDPFLKLANEKLATFSTSNPSEMYDVMISYQSSQLVIAKRIKTSLEKLGLSVWFNLDVGGGDVYSKMADGVLMSKVVVPCLSLEYEADPDRKKELGFAADQVREGKKVVPVRLDDGPFTWSALITAGLLYTYIGKSQLSTQAKWDEAMTALCHEITVGAEEFNARTGISSKQPVISEEFEDERTEHYEPPVEQQAEKFDVMLSYNWGHQPLVVRMRDALRKRGLEVWMDVEEMSGNVYAKMSEAVLSSKVIVSCLTHAYERSFNCKRELNFSWDQVIIGETSKVGHRKKSVIPLFLEPGPFTWSAEITEGLKSFTIHEDTASDTEKFESIMDQLANLIKACIDGESLLLPGFENKYEQSVRREEPVVETDDVVISRDLLNSILTRLDVLESKAKSESELERRVVALEEQLGRMEKKWTAFQDVVDGWIGEI